jgi:hypothetical protein
MASVPTDFPFPHDRSSGSIQAYHQVHGARFRYPQNLSYSNLRDLLLEIISQKEIEMEIDFNMVYHAVCLVMFFGGAFLSKGKLNYGAAICTLGLVLLACAYTGVLGSFLALFH